MSKEEDYIKSLPAAARPYLKEELDWDNDGVEEDLCEIASDMSDWEAKLDVPLGLTQIDISDIKSKHPNQPVLQRRAALRNWKDKKALEGTYGNLLKAFVKANHKECAQALCKVLKKRTGDESNQEPQPDSRPTQAEKITGVEQISSSGDDVRRESPHLRHRSFIAEANDEDTPRVVLPKKDTRGKSGLTIYVVGGIGIIFLCVVAVIVLPPFLAETCSTDKGPSVPTKGTNRPATPEMATPASGCLEVKDIYKLYKYLYNDIGDWETLCSRLGVKKGKIATIRDSPQASGKLYSCLEAFMDLGEPDSCWEKVVSTVCGPPFIKKRLGKTIATDLGIAVPSECT